MAAALLIQLPKSATATTSVVKTDELDMAQYHISESEPKQAIELEPATKATTTTKTTK